VVLRAQIVRVILGSGAFDWDATRLTAAALAILVVSLLAQSLTFLLARGYYAAGRTSRPLTLAFISVVVSVASAYFLLHTFTSVPAFHYFVEFLLRVGDVAGTSMLMLAVGFSLGSIFSAVLGLWFFSMDFKVSLKALGGTFMRSFSASIIGGFGSYLGLTFVGNLVNINTFPGIFAQGLAGGIMGLAVTGFILYVLKSPELAEVIDALKRRLIERADVALEPSDLSSNPTT
jgi:peptidoglycan biosynthesis protein MviN/MurJ (putative lipid II flippase)